MDRSLYSHSATIFPVSDVTASANWYQKYLGFELTFTWEEPATYAVLKANESISIHLSKSEQPIQPSAQTALLIFVHDVDRIYQTIMGHQLTIETPLGIRDYGMKDFDLRDPDGYLLSFGQGNSQTE